MNTMEPVPAGWQRHSFWAMGCQMAAWLEIDDQAAAAAAFAEVEALFAKNEQALSRFRADSELTLLNANSGAWTPVSDLLWDVLTLALGMAAVTDGRFDPTLLTALEQAGYTESFERITSGGDNGRWQAHALAVGRWADVQLDEARQAVYLPEGVRIDFGGIAKGYTAQQAVNVLSTWGPCLVDAGGDLAAGAAPTGYPGWPVAVGAPWTKAAPTPEDLVTLWLAQGALATSGIDYRSWERDGQVKHHLIDPQTAVPADTDALTVTVLHQDAAQAEAWATATLVAGSRAGLDALVNLELAGLMVTGNGRVLVTPAMHRYMLDMNDD